MMQAGHVKLYGIFSQEKEVTLGTGGTKRKAVAKSHWFVKEIKEDEVHLHSLDIDFKPQGELRMASREDVIRDFLPEPQLTYKHLSRPLMEGDQYRELGKHAVAAREYEKVREIDEDNIRANFGLGISLLALGRTDKARYVFTNILSLDEAFRDEHKHLFNEFGISLRRKGLYEETLNYYFKAQEMTSLDENLQFNIARAFMEMGNVDKAVWHLAKALDINSFFDEGLRFAKYIVDQGILSEDDTRRQQLVLSLRSSGYLG